MSMNNNLALFHRVHERYMHNAHMLPLRKQFHFFSRLYLWTREEEYRHTLQHMHDEWWKSFDTITQRSARIQSEPPRFVEPKKKYRISAMRTYGAIGIYNRLLFRCLYDRTIFNGNAFTQIRELIDSDHMFTLREQLVSDQNALFALSTPAVNFLTLTQYFFANEVRPLAPQFFLDVGEACVLSDQADDNDARIYFYTHSIIGASHFYADRLHESDISLYIDMVKCVERLIQSRYESFSLDHKCEFVVCAKLCGYTSSLSEKIHTELLQSCSSDEPYFLNVQNTYAQRRKKQSFSSMEHTNVLALMGFYAQKSEISKS
jgi:hypothetical protein